MITRRGATVLTSLSVVTLLVASPAGAEIVFDPSVFARQFEQLTEMKKHQQMTDTFLGTMLEQREKMHAQMQKRHEQMRGQMGKKQPMGGSGTTPSGEHEQHHDK